MRRLVAAMGFSMGAAAMLASAACTSILGGFEIAESAADAGPSDAGEVADTSTPDVTTGGNDAAPDVTTDAATITCPKNLANCDNDPSNGCETSLLAPDSCGACGRKCGGTAACTQGECTAEVLSSTLDHPFGFALAGGRALWMSPSAVWGCSLASCSTSTAIMVDIETTSNNPVPTAAFSPRQIHVVGSSFYYEKCPAGSPNSDCAPAVCPVTGCKVGGSINGSTFLATGSGFRRASLLVGGPGSVYTWQGLDRLQRYDLAPPGLGNVPGYAIVDYFGAMYADATSFVYIDDNPSVANPTGGLYVCPIGGCATRPPTLLPPPLRHLTVGKGIAVTTTGGAANIPSATVLACPLTGCAGSGAIFAQSQAYVSDIVADDKDVYWSTVGAANVSANAAPVGTIMRCALPACAGGPVEIAKQVVNPVGLQIDPEYVYWITYGTGATQNGTLVRRRR